MEGLKAKGVDDVLVLGGGVIPMEDVPVLKQCGITEIFGPGTSTQTIIECIGEMDPRGHEEADGTGREGHSRDQAAP